MDAPGIAVESTVAGMAIVIQQCAVVAGIATSSGHPAAKVESGTRRASAWRHLLSNIDAAQRTYSCQWRSMPATMVGLLRAYIAGHAAFIMPLYA